MKIIAFIEGHQGDVIRKILEHCGLWENSPSRGPPKPLPTPTPDQAGPDPDSRLSYQADPDFLEHARREQSDESAGQLALPWDD